MISHHVQGQEDWLEDMDLEIRISPLTQNQDHSLPKERKKKPGSLTFEV
jgi:hypothetical protein